MKRIHAAAVAIAALSAMATTAAVSAKAEDNGVPGALASISGVLSTIQATLNEIRTSLKTLATPPASTVLVTGVRNTTTAIGCILVNVGPGNLVATVQPSRQFGGPLNTSQVNIPAGGGATLTNAPTGGVPGGSYCTATVTAGDPRAARLTLCADASLGATLSCAAYADDR